MISVILKQDVESLGRAGEIVRVKPGYGRNYLIPRGMALLATRGNVAQHEHHRRAIEAEQARMRAEQQKTADLLKNTSVSIARKAGKDNKLFGSVSSRDIVEALAMQNIEVDRRLVQLPDPIRETGTFEVVVRFSVDVQVPLKVNVVGI
ncbi:50S ribosomal protein L9 [Paraliomyxa miuraensis]|uniref:50S ribosomal protein L9 n=1 Tax=Paraliomyxa miuraensis TaxID=376150 RepID=UPI002250C41E|nr:50S ribosomal protein L9 [Paraliomyxa miuraensis]MCX4244115.1 50S ribosomal protein L9 [Paraliomyxa miuraensis]